jgi:hypothetical protein
MTRALRVIAVLIAVGGLIDPAWAVRRLQPLPVVIRIGSSAAAASIRDRLVASLGTDFVVNTGAAPAAIVLIGSAAVPSLRDGMPISVVDLVPAGPNVRLVRVVPPDTVLPGQDAAIAAEFEASGLAGQSSTIDLEQDGVRLARIDHRWSRDGERFTALLSYPPPATGIQRATVVAQPIAAERTADDNAADVPVVAAARTLRVAIYEPRPSWASGFVRRALESDAAFDVASLTRSSRGIDVRAGTPPNALTAAALAPFDAVLVGAPEELRATEVEALDEYAHVRGGAVVFLPDRRPSGRYATLLPAARFEELLLEKGLRLEDGHAAGVSASELALPQRLTGGGVALASITHQGTTRAVIASWPRGPGRIVFSGALDAWRFRARDEDAFARFWTSAVANVAAASSRRLSVSVSHAIAAPDEPVAVRAVLRRGEQLRLEASLVDEEGRQRFVRLWPVAEPGAFEGIVTVPAGRYVVRVNGDGGVRAETPLIVADGVRHPPDLDQDALALLAAATGGVASTASDLGLVERHLRGLRGSLEAPARLYPMRSVWWGLAFAAALCGEWTLARRRGAR